MSKTKTAVTAGSAGAIACCVAFLPAWEGMDKVARRDAIGTGHPITYCYGQTDEFGAVKVGQRFTKQECDAALAASLPKYLAQIEPCIHVPLPDKSKAALLDAAYNAGPARVCHSPMVAKMNAGDLRGGCNAFAGWIVRSDGQVRRGLVARRGGDGRKGEKQLCLEGLTEGVPAPVRAVKNYPNGDPYACSRGPGDMTPLDKSCVKHTAPAKPKSFWSWIFK